LMRHESRQRRSAPRPRDGAPPPCLRARSLCLMLCECRYAMLITGAMTPFALHAPDASAVGEFARLFIFFEGRFIDGSVIFSSRDVMRPPPARLCRPPPAAAVYAADYAACGCAISRRPAIFFIATPDAAIAAATRRHAAHAAAATISTAFAVLMPRSSRFSPRCQLPQRLHATPRRCRRRLRADVMLPAALRHFRPAAFAVRAALQRQHARRTPKRLDAAGSVSPPDTVSRLRRPRHHRFHVHHRHFAACFFCCFLRCLFIYAFRTLHTPPHASPP